MNRYAPFLALTALLFASLSCKALAPETPIVEEQPQAIPTTGVESQPTVEASSPQLESNGATDEDIPIPAGAVDLIKTADILSFNILMTLEEGYKYYQTEMPARGYVEVTSISHIVPDAAFSLVFSGHSSGMEVVIQGIQSDSLLIKISIRLEDMLK